MSVSVWSPHLQTVKQPNLQSSSSQLIQHILQTVLALKQRNWIVFIIDAKGHKVVPGIAVGRAEGILFVSPVLQRSNKSPLDIAEVKKSLGSPDGSLIRNKRRYPERVEGTYRFQPLLS